MNVPVPVSMVQQQPPVYNPTDEQNRLKLPAAAVTGNAPLTQREVSEPTDEEFRSAFNIMPRILQLLTSASHGLHPQSFMELRTELQRCKLLLDLMPGIDSSLAQQNHVLKNTKNMIATQHKLLRQYKDLDVFKMAKSDTSDKR